MGLRGGVVFSGGCFELDVEGVAGEDEEASLLLFAELDEDEATVAIDEDGIESEAAKDCRDRASSRGNSMRLLLLLPLILCFMPGVGDPLGLILISS